VTIRRTVGRFVVRPATAEDAGTLARFRCSTGPWYEQDVEDFVRRFALERALAAPNNYRLLLALEGGRPVCCMAHHGEMLFRKGSEFPDPMVVAARLHLLAITVEDQGRRLDDGTRLSDLAMATLIADALETREVHAATAIVALDNLRSIALCKRHGLRSQVRYDAQHARLSGHLTLRG
jgi:hypothetical protein